MACFLKNQREKQRSVSECRMTQAQTHMQVAPGVTLDLKKKMSGKEKEETAVSILFCCFPIHTCTIPQAFSFSTTEQIGFLPLPMGCLHIPDSAVIFDSTPEHALRSQTANKQQVRPPYWWTREVNQQWQQCRALDGNHLSSRQGLMGLILRVKLSTLSAGPKLASSLTFYLRTGTETAAI